MKVSETSLDLVGNLFQFWVSRFLEFNPRYNKNNPKFTIKIASPGQKTA